MSAAFGITATVVVAAGLAAVVLVAVRGYARPAPWWRLLPSVLPLTLLAGVVLVLGSGGN
jgi:hypothetical protein